MASYTHTSEVNINAGLNINLNSKAEEEIKRLSDSVDNLKEELKSAYEDIKQLTNELDNTRSSKGIDELEAKVLKFESASKKAAAEFKAFLQASDLVDVDGTGLEKFKELMDQIIAGSKTMQQAVVQVKSEYTEFFKSGESASGTFDSQAIQQFTASIEAMSGTLDGVHKIVSDIQANGVQVSGAVSGVGDSAATTLEKIQEAARGMDDELKGAYDAITNLTKAIVEYANIDNSKLFAVSNTFKSIADIGNGRFGGKTLQNLLDFLSRAKTVIGTQGLDIKISSDLDKLNGLKISSTVGQNLALIKTAVENFDVERLRGIASINFEQLNNLKVSKASAKNLAELAQVYTTLEKIQERLGAAPVEQPEIISEETAAKAAESAGVIEEAIGRVEEVVSDGIQGVEAVDSDAHELAESVTEAAEVVETAKETIEHFTDIDDIDVASSFRELSGAMEEEISSMHESITELDDIGLKEAFGRLKETVDLEDTDIRTAFSNLTSAMQAEIDSFTDIEDLTIEEAFAGLSDTLRTNVSELTDIDDLDTGSLFSKLTESLDEELSKMQGTITDIDDLDLKNLFGELSTTGIDDFNEAVIRTAESVRELDDLNPEELFSELNEVMGQGDFVETLQEGMKQYYTALRQVEELSNRIQVNSAKWGQISGISEDKNFQAYTAQLKELDGLKESIKSGSITNEEYRTSMERIKLAVTEAGSAVKALADSQQQNDSANQKIINGSKEYYQSLDKINKMLAQVRNGEREWTAAKNGSSADAYKDYVAQGTALDDLANKLKSGEITVNEFNEAVARIASVMSESSNAISSAGEATKSFSDRFGSIAKNLSIYFGASRILMTAIRTFKDMVKTAMEIENSMNQLQIVTGATDQEMQSFFDSASRQAQELGKSITDVAKSIETFSRLGYDLVDAGELSKYANILSNIADTDVNTATTGLTSIIKGYDMDVSEAEHVADVLTQVGQKYAISAEELMAAFQRGGAALYASGTDFEKSAALFAATNASLQNAEAVGTLWKTVSARIRGRIVPMYSESYIPHRVEINAA